MSTIEGVRKEITDLIGKLVEVGLCRDQNYPSIKNYPGGDHAISDLGISGASEIALALKERPYSEIYAGLLRNRAYNILMIDGAMLQLRYRYNGGVLLKHVLAFYPSPDLLEYQNDPEIYETEFLYADFIRKDVVTSPIRFDFDGLAFEEAVHPMSHFTLGQYKNCRIPVSRALTPHRFVNFILRAFYNTPFRAFCATWRGTAGDFPASVTEVEKADLHLSFG